MEPSYTVGRALDWCSQEAKQYRRFLKNLKLELPYDLAIPLLGKNPEKNYNSNRHMHPVFHGSTVSDGQDLGNLDAISKWIAKGAWYI